MSRTMFSILLVAVLAATTSAFVPAVSTTTTTSSKPALVVRLEAHPNENNKNMDKIKHMVTVASAAAVTASAPLVAMAEETDDYVYGAVNAPIGIAWGAGVLAILTALLPVFLSSGEDAFNEMRDADAEGWGTGNSDKLRNRK
eukprot:CAMPEP_0195269456 /NCGR_PEP_ID=MMETSP0706-20130129/13782_1 /TAXON_ID=33640 /ORGANISM="Asterionellopsis glacialis, Strain CCMP134" /LENGTH=142 /DNA_ID=CAMNT_0040324573 /DNA_START=118 /DNA_END=546 /DNA_ORIENTATION=-